jgi:ABC-2 type transport system permease protein
MKQNVSWQSVLTLFRLDLRSRKDATTELTKKDKAMKVLNVAFGAVVYALLVVGIYFLTRMFVVRAEMRIEFLTIATLITMGISTVVAIGNVVKNLYMNGDNELLLRFPVNGTEILIAKSIYCALHNFVVSVGLTLPFYVVFGVITNASVGYYFASILMMIFTSMLPFFIANLVAIPVMRVVNVIKNQFLLVLIIIIAAICGCFVLYMTALSGILEYLADNKVNLFDDPVIRENIVRFAHNCYPFNWYAYLLNGKVQAGLTSKDLGLAFLYLFLINGAFGVSAFFVTTKFYYSTILKGIETEKESLVVRKPRNVQRSVFGTLLRREFMLIFRSFNYSFQYLAMACAAPVMVYYCNALASAMGAKSVGTSIVPGLTLLVVTIFVTIIVSFASTSISREGNVFYHTKVIPVSFTNQILTKLFLYGIVGTASVVLCCVTVGAAFATEAGGNLLSPLDVGMTFLICELTVLAQTCLSVWADIKSPTFNVAGDGELVAANKNVALALFIGIFTAVVYGVFAMVFSFKGLALGALVIDMTPAEVYGVLIGVSGAVLIASASLLFVGLEKRYHKITP